MRLVQLAKALGMTGQQLRKELELVNFGVKPTDREVPDNLVSGIVRFIANKHNLTVDMSQFGFVDEDATMDSNNDGSIDADEEESVEDEPEDEPVEETPKDERKPTSTSETATSTNFNVLRKLSLENVPKAAVEKERKKLRIVEPHGSQKSTEDKKANQVVKKVPKKPTSQVQIKRKEGTVLLPEQVSVKEFAEKTGIQIPQIIAELMKNGVMATINQTIDYETAAIVAGELGIDVKKQENTIDAEHLYSRNLEELLKDEPENLTPRAPIVVVMGHVDHGKTSILDAVRETDVAAKEAGGITQHIGAYQVLHKSSDGVHPITFLDTPGHEAFTAMRARGAQITDIAVIVVAATEGVKPTTIEAINHAKEAAVPIIVAINKMDLEGADPEKVKGELAGYGLQAEDWGGDTPMVPCSAHTKQGIDDLLDNITLIAQMNELRANVKRSAVATVVESHVDPSLGAIATVVINAGTLNIGDAFICGAVYGKVRAMMESHGKRQKSVGPSGAVRISGFSDNPQTGDILQVVANEQKAKELVGKVTEIDQSKQKRSFADLVSRLSEGKLNQLKIVMKADTQGSLEALREALAKLATKEVSVKVIHGAIGAVSENDVMMAAASDGIVIAFHADVSGAVQRTAEREGVKVREYDVVYTLLEDITGLLQGLVEPEETEQIIGHLEVLQVFLTKKKEQIVGGKVTDGVIKRLSMRVQRDGEEVGTGRISSVKRVDKDIKEAPTGSECGCRIESSILIEAGDVLEVYLQELKKKS